MDDLGPPTKEDMLLAFGYETARNIVASDGVARSSELSDLDRRFPAERMQARGLLDGGTRTPRFGEAYNLALSQLRSLLEEGEKLQLAQAFFEICSADDSVEAAEVDVIVRAMAVVGLDKAKLVQYLKERTG